MTIQTCIQAGQNQQWHLLEKPIKNAPEVAPTDQIFFSLLKNIPLDKVAIYQLFQEEEHVRLFEKPKYIPGNYYKITDLTDYSKKPEIKADDLKSNEATIYGRIFSIKFDQINPDKPKPHIYFSIYVSDEKKHPTKEFLCPTEVSKNRRPLLDFIKKIFFL